MRTGRAHSYSRATQSPKQGNSVGICEERLVALAASDIGIHRDTSGHSRCLHREFIWVALASLFILAIANIPYVLAFTRTDGAVFGGALLAVPDGYSYLAKMQLGASGAWLYTLRFTTEPGPGVLLFTFYIALGQLARLTGLGVLAIYHAARFLAGFFFLLTAYRVIRPLAPDLRRRLSLWGLFALSSGLGWLVTPLTGALSPDLWVAESIPLLSLIANPHFPLAWALVLWLLYSALPAWSGPAMAARLWRVAGLSVVLGEVYPMALPVVLGVLAVLAAFAGLERRAWPGDEIKVTAAATLAAAPRLVYTAWIVATHPQLAAWNAQNTSPSPEWPLALAWGGLALLLAGLGAWRTLRARPISERDRIWIMWLVVGVAGLYAPYELQRRLSLGLMFPITMLAAGGWAMFANATRIGRWRAPVRILLGLGLALSNLLVWAGALAAALGHDPEIFLSSAEARAIDTLTVDDVVLAAPELGGFIPTRSLARVVYGHAAETPHAEAMRQVVEAFYSGNAPADEALRQYGVTRVIYGPREAALGQLPALPAGWHVVTTEGDVRVFGPEAGP